MDRTQKELKKKKKKVESNIFSQGPLSGHKLFTFWI